MLWLMIVILFHKDRPFKMDYYMVGFPTKQSCDSARKEMRMKLKTTSTLMCMEYRSNDE